MEEGRRQQRQEGWPVLANLWQRSPSACLQHTNTAGGMRVLNPQWVQRLGSWRSTKHMGSNQMWPGKEGSGSEKVMELDGFAKPRVRFYFRREQITCFPEKSNQKEGEAPHRPLGWVFFHPAGWRAVAHSVCTCRSCHLAGRLLLGCASRWKSCGSSAVQ